MKGLAEKTDKVKVSGFLLHLLLLLDTLVENLVQHLK